MARPHNTQKNKYIVFLKCKGAKNPCKSLLNIHDNDYIILNGITSNEAYTEAIELSRTNEFMLENELVPFHIRRIPKEFFIDSYYYNHCLNTDIIY